LQVAKTSLEVLGVVLGELTVRPLRALLHCLIEEIEQKEGQDLVRVDLRNSYDRTRIYVVKY